MDHDKPGILDIPMEMLEKIFTNLEAPDIISCTKVCNQFWLATKGNKLWQQMCERFCDRSTNVIDYVNTVPSTVEPVYSPPQEVQASVCEWRKVYMKLIKLKRNLINGVYKIHFFTDYPIDTRIRVSVFQDLLMIHKHHSTEIKGWHNSTEPRLVGTINYALTNEETKVFNVGTNIVVVVQGTVLQVYKINVESGDITRMYRRLVYGNNNSDIPEEENIDSWYLNRTQPTPEYVSSYVTGKYFICVVSLSDQIILYQWNIETGQNVYEWNISCLNFVSLISPETYTGHILVVISTEFTNPSTWYICRYNLESHLIQYLFLIHTEYQPAIHYENNKIAVLGANRFSNELYLHNLQPCSVDMPATISIFFKGGIILDNLLMSPNIVLYVLGHTLIIQDNNLNDIYYVSLLRNNDHGIPICMLCNWNIVLVSLVNIFQGDSVIELHDIIAKSCIQTFNIDGILLRRRSCVNIFFQQYVDDRCYVNSLKFW